MPSRQLEEDMDNILQVKEVVKWRWSAMGASWGEWKIPDGDYDAACKKAMEVTSNPNNWNECQVAKMYYSLNDEYIAWDGGIVICNGRIMEEIMPY